MITKSKYFEKALGRTYQIENGVILVFKGSKYIKTISKKELETLITVGRVQ